MYVCGSWGKASLFGLFSPTVCPSGLRGWTQVPLAQAAWFQIPQLSLKISKLVSLYGAVWYAKTDWKSPRCIAGYSSVGRASDCRICRNQMVPVQFRVAGFDFSVCDTWFYYGFLKTCNGIISIHMHIDLHGLEPTRKCILTVVLNTISWLKSVAYQRAFKILNLAGLEPAISCSVGRWFIQWATGPFGHS